MVDAGPESTYEDKNESNPPPPLGQEVQGRIQDFLNGGSYNGEGVRFADFINFWSHGDQIISFS